MLYITIIIGRSNAISTLKIIKFTVIKENCSGNGRDYMASNDVLVALNGEQVKIRKEIIIVCMKILSQHF
jgi:hypothetical protein